MYDFSNIICLLETVVDMYEQERDSHWSGKIEYDQAERFAKSVLKSSEQLIEIEPIDDDLGNLQYEATKRTLYDLDKNHPAWQALEEIIMHGSPNPDERLEQIRKFTENFPIYINFENVDKELPLRLTWERFSIDLAWEATHKVEEGVGRIFELYRLILRTHLSKSTKQFLTRLSRCYIWGFNPECVILCRAVMDTAFRDAVADDVCEKHLGKRQYNSFTLNDRIHTAAREGIIDERTKKLAKTIKERGDKAVHYQPDITKNIFATIRDTVTVIEKLQKKD